MLSGDKQSEPPTPHSPPQKSGHTNSNGVKIRPLDKDYNLNQQIPPGILLGLSSSSKGIKDFNGHTAMVAKCSHEEHVSLWEILLGLLLAAHAFYC